MYYYPVSISADKIFGEDNARVVERRFDFMSYYELPTENRNLGIMGITVTDNFPIFVSIMHFNYVSRCNVSGTYDDIRYTFPVIPKIGDVVYAKYNNTLYIITMVKTELHLFLQGKHTYTIQLEVFRDKGYLFSSEFDNIPDDPFFNVSKGTTEKDMFDISGTVEQEKTNILYQEKVGDCQPKDPFNNWWS
jgi:hypothetical protein